MHSGGVGRGVGGSVGGGVGEVWEMCGKEAGGSVTCGRIWPDLAEHVRI